MLLDANIPCDCESVFHSIRRVHDFVTGERKYDRICTGAE